MGISLDVIVPGTIGNYDDLVAMVGNWLDRDDLTDRIPEFVALLEARLNRLLRTVMQETPATWAITGEEYALPDDFREIITLVESGRINLMPWISHRFDLADTPRRFPEIAANPDVIKTLIST